MSVVVHSFAARALLVGLGVLGAVLAAGPAAASETTIDSPLCAVAAELVDNAQPQRALGVIAAARNDSRVPTLCPSTEARAALAVQVAANAVARAQVEADATEPDWEQVLHQTDVALAADKQASGLTALRAEARDHLPGTALDSSAAQEEGWAAFRDDALWPAARLLLAGLAVAAVLAVLARGVVLLWPRPWPRTSTRARRTAALVGSLGLLAAAASPVWLDGSSTTVLAATAAGFVLTVACWALVLATRPRLAIEVRDETGAASETGAARLLAALRDIAADGPRGLEVPRGTDVRLLEAQRITVVRRGEQPGAALLRTVLGTAPWRVTVSIEPNGDTCAVITRNGRSAGGAVVAPAPRPGDDAPVADPHTMTAAFVLVTLSRCYRDGFEPLGGASDWRSLGWTCAASTQPVTDEVRIDLLRRAVERDPGNLLAQVALRHARHRHSEDPYRLQQYATWLHRQAEALASSRAVGRPSPVGLRPLRARLLLTATATELNRLAIGQSPRRRGVEARSDAWHPVQQSAVELVDVLRRFPEADPFAEQLRPVAAVLTLAAFGAGADTSVLDEGTLSSTQRRALDRARRWHDAVEASPEAAYAEACRLVELARPGHDRPLVTRALDLLAGEVERPHGRERMSRDPYLKELVASGRFKKRYPTPPRDDLVELAPFDRHAEQLRLLALDTPTALWEAAEDSTVVEELATHLRVLPSVVRRLGEAAAIAADVPEHLNALRYEVYAALWDCGIRSLEDFRALSAVQLATVVKEAGAERGLWFAKEPDTDPVLLEWFTEHGALAKPQIPAQRAPRSSARRT